MDPLRVIAETRGVFLTSEARELGHDDQSISRAVRLRIWHRVRRGAYTFTDIWAAADEQQRHRILARAVMRSFGDSVALSHVSAALEHGLDVWGIDLSRVHVTRLDGAAGRTEKDVVHHEGFSLDSDLEIIDGMHVTTAARATLETGSLGSVEAGLVTFDSALHLGRVVNDELESGLALLERWPRTRHLHVTLGLADGRAESVGESRARYLCWAHQLPAPELQFEVRDARGAVIGITDMAWLDHGLLGEFDGKVKYGRFLRPGESPADAVFREKRREDLLREATLWQMIRLIWADLHRGRETASRIRRLLHRAA